MSKAYGRKVRPQEAHPGVAHNLPVLQLVVPDRLDEGKGENIKKDN